MSQIFLTGASGYVGGQVLYSLVNAHPEFAIRALVRDSAKAQAITRAFPNVQVVEGSLDDEELMAQEAGKANIILHLAATGHLKSVQTIHNALKGNSGKPAHWIQISGATLLSASELADKSRTPGTPSDIVYDDLNDAAAIHDMIKSHPTRAVDNYILDLAQNTPEINTALIVGPIIYGPGQGPVKQRSVQVPSLAKATLERKRGLQVGKGQNRWGNVHVQDLGELVVLLVEQALADKTGQELWNLNGVYLMGVGEVPFADISQCVATTAAEKGYVPNDAVDEVLGDEANSLLPHGTALFGTNARGEPKRAIQCLGWKPKHANGLAAEIPRALDEEAKSLGLVH